MNVTLRNNILKSTVTPSANMYCINLWKSCNRFFSKVYTIECSVHDEMLVSRKWASTVLHNDLRVLWMHQTDKNHGAIKDSNWVSAILEWSHMIHVASLNMWIARFTILKKGNSRKVVLDPVWPKDHAAKANHKHILFCGCEICVIDANVWRVIRKQELVQFCYNPPTIE